MTELLKYTGEDWEAAFNQADDAEFCEIDSRESAGELAGVVAELHGAEAGNDEGLLYAAITVARSLAEEFDRDLLGTVLNGHNQDHEGMEQRATGYILAKWPGFPIEEIGDLFTFGTKYALREYERVADDGSTGFRYVFNVSKVLGKD
ncbi:MULTISPECIES: hypothetical protein [unclassified Streptomyces]|uniref:hypothetical protein n=1 Tax=unclassified Streptomyces TaxID=2593676 RepID=UPI002E29CE0B|nr:hypothetical protein [Streptomyces sp. NBC_00285]